VELTDTVGYVRIKSMWRGPLSYVFKGYMRRERKTIREFLERGRGRYKKLIIDTRNNGGGLTEYVYENLLCPFLARPLTFKQVAGLRKKYLQDTRQSALQDLKKQYARYVIETREVKPPNGFAENDWAFYEITRQIRSSERYSFQGKIYVLINGGCWSAADDYADLVKRTGLGTLVGQNTSGGGGGYLLPPAIRLPRSGMIFRVEAELLLTPNGGFNELFGTEPDVRLPSADPPKSITREDLLKDEWIKHIITEL
jgi:C-terminal processing protease CtpA/Prc